MSRGDCCWVVVVAVAVVAVAVRLVAMALLALPCRYGGGGGRQIWELLPKLGALLPKLGAMFGGVEKRST